MTLPAEDFEELARTAPETVRLELVGGRIEVKPVQDGNHSEIVMWLQMTCRDQLPWAWLYQGCGLKTGSNGTDRVRPDGVLAPRRHFAGHGEWSDPKGVLMVVGVTAHNAHANHCERVAKRDGYAAAGIPVCLLVDREDSSVAVYSVPEGGRYRSLTLRAYGTPIEIPEPVGITLETEELKDFAD
ncbi:Uma2 family endonuclease [Streptomyces sp. NPDC002536]